jgi:hypothetical protein
LSPEGLPGFESWGAVEIQSGKLVSSLLAFTCDHCCNILYQQSRTDYLRLGVNNALTYVFTNEVLKRNGISEVFYGLHSLDAPASVDDFKFRMGFTAKPVRQRVAIHPWIAPLFNRVSQQAVRTLWKLKPGACSLAKVEGMIRFYREGKLPLDQQQWPEALSEQKASLLGAAFAGKITATEESPLDGPAGTAVAVGEAGPHEATGDPVSPAWVIAESKRPPEH